MKSLYCAITIIFGLFWLVFGLNNFYHFFPIPEPSAAGKEFMNALENTGYTLPIVYGTQVLTGIMLLTRRFIPLALLFLAPIVANILLYDLFLNPSGLLIGGIVAAFYAVLLFKHKERFLPFLKP